MKINSELPLCLLSQNNDINEYDFVLFHLYISNKDYRNYYRNQRILFPGRLMILDNSAYEFFVKGEELDFDKYVEVILELKPDFYILPDVLMDKDKTLRGAMDFESKYASTIMKKSLNIQPLAVAQGNSKKDLVECLDKYRNWRFHNVAIPFHNRFFYEMGKVVPSAVQKTFTDIYGTPVTDDHLYAMGRVRFILESNWRFEDFAHVHLLGSHCPFEKLFYKELNITTMDTGYPVKCALEGYELGKEPHKPNVIIDEFLDKELDKGTKQLIRENVLKFRHL